ncbi:MAG: TIGR01777 family protein [Saprospiraceae bacterium]|nr:TIGR01777 family protein [Saprospiraceae bacterium]
MNTILIIGGSGLVGRHLTQMLLRAGYKVIWLTRHIQNDIDIVQYKWDWQRQTIDRTAFEETDTIINLSGASINGRRWNTAWKKAIYDSRVRSTNFLFECISKQPNKIKTYISASATGIYGVTTTDHIFHETDEPANDFLAKTCQDWEYAASQFSSLGIRTVMIRSGIALSSDSTAFKNIILPVKWGLGAALGTGQQVFPWIYVEDLCGIYMRAVEYTSMYGAYNAVAPESITNHTLMKSLANHLQKPFWLPNVPAWVIKTLFGQLADSLLRGSRISADKIQSTGFKFEYPQLNKALYAIVPSRHS